MTSHKVSMTLVSGDIASKREAIITGLLDPSLLTCLILEGLPDGKSPLGLSSSLPFVHIARIAPGCMCCTGNLTMRVTLNRMLRLSPDHIYVSLAAASHLEEIKRFLTAAPYADLLSLTPDIHA